jgi:hypothetical protein
MPWVSRIGFSVALWVLKRTFKWALSTEHVAQERERFRAYWWEYRQKAAASPNAYDDQIANAIGVFFSFTHSPDEKAALEASKADLIQDPKNKPPNFMD